MTPRRPTGRGPAPGRAAGAKGRGASISPAGLEDFRAAFRTPRHVRIEPPSRGGLLSGCQRVFCESAGGSSDYV
ncbi:hypothetical protein Kpho02_19330 [Kitasatospora phosalacinea]|uniref:Uncharacterized protein n=1 Tax=Kitasatospora phosalacinea TaxID=2065 RepID=A0A9W6UZG8_9ACTN|nr:hypothetical protein Kpho02_19330 [Kitasatospora phosalacinea]